MTNTPRKNIKEFLAWLEDQQEQLKELNKMMPDGNKFHLYFRGLSDSSYKNIPSIYRDGLVENEDVIFKECLCRNSDDFAKDRSTFDKLVKMQHYGIPTRLLDITTNPLIALYFACRQSSIKPSPNGAVYAFFVSEKAIKYSDSDTVSAVANLALRPYEQMTTLGAEKEYQAYAASLETEERSEQQNLAYERYRTAFNEQEAISYLLHDIRSEKPYFQSIIKPEHLESIWCVRPKLNNNRIVRQDGAFLLFGILINKSNPLPIPNLEEGKKYLGTGQTIKMLKRKYILPAMVISKKDYRLLLRNLATKYYNSFDAEALLKPFEDSVRTIFVTEKISVKIQSLIMRSNYQQKSNFYAAYIHSQCAKKSKPNRTDENDPKFIEQMNNALANIIDNNLYCNCLQQDGPLILLNKTEISSENQFNRDLEAFAITKDKLFPELDHVAAFLRDKYKKNRR